MTLLRTAKPADLSTVAALQMRWAGEQNTHGFAAATPERIARYLGKFFLVAEEHSEIVGFAYGAGHVSEGTAVIPQGASYFEIDDIYVLPSHRHAGLGGRMIDELLDRARQSGCEYSLIYSSAKDFDGIVEFYRRHGFESWYVQMFRRLGDEK